MLKRRRAPPAGDGASRLSAAASAEDNAAALLLSFQDVRSPAGHQGLLRPKDVGGGGWCFFLAFYDQLGSEAIPECRYLALLALVAIAERAREFEASVQAVDFFGAEVRDLRDARSALRRVAAYRALGVVELLTPFQCRVLDKLEGVLEWDLQDSRRYADDDDLQVLLQTAELQALVLESGDVDVGQASARSRVYPTWDPVGPRVRERLAAGELDLVFVRDERGAHMHYTSVAFGDGQPWRVGAGKREFFETLYHACGGCRAVRDDDCDVARMLMLAKLGVDLAFGASAGVLL